MYTGCAEIAHVRIVNVRYIILCLTTIDKICFFVYIFNNKKFNTLFLNFEHANNSFTIHIQWSSHDKSML